MALKWLLLHDENAHEAGRELLGALYFERFGKAMPEICLTKQGKPYFANGSAHFSISHTPRHAFCCLSDKNIGIDAEECDRAVQPVMAKKLLSPGEFAHWERADDKNACLLRLWVLKEAYAKLTGRGIGNYLRETNFNPNDSRIQIIDGCFVAIMEE